MTCWLTAFSALRPVSLRSFEDESGRAASFERAEQDQALAQNRFDRMEVAGVHSVPGTHIPFVVAYIGFLKMDSFQCATARA